MFNDRFADRKVLVTGHTGFKGTWMTLWLQQMGAEVTGFALPPESDRGVFVAADVDAGMRSITGDLRDPELVRSAVEVADPQIVFHLAAQPLVRRSYADPTETFATNVMGTVHLLEALRDRPELRAVVVVTSDKCYENREWIWGYREDEALGGADPYSASKACQEHVAAAYRRSFFSGDVKPVGVATARAGNVIGGGDRAADRLIPDIIDAFAAEIPVEVRNPDATRPWQHVLDPIAGYLTLAERLADDPASVATSYNFGPSTDDVWPVRRIVEHLTERWGNDASWRRDDRPHPHEARSLQLDATRARVDLEWRPQLDTETALDWTVDWSRNQHEGRDVRRVTLDQLEKYQGIVGSDRVDGTPIEGHTT